MVGVDDLSIGLVPFVGRAGHDHVDERIFAVLSLSFDDQRVARRHKPHGDRVGAVDGAGAEIVERGGQRVGHGGHDFHVIYGTGHVFELGGKSGRGVDGDQPGRLQQFDGASAVGGVVGDADPHGGGGGRSGQNRGRGAGENFQRFLHDKFLRK